MNLGSSSKFGPNYFVVANHWTVDDAGAFLPFPWLNWGCSFLMRTICNQ